ncbi:MAG: PHP domain-containing protein [Candidatus Hydrogenedentes bacterium]|nr:PHP domain-containing protein [Candidatus Hydrogenedentota bacterium]
MGFCIDMHMHTRRYSKCSVIDPDGLIRQAVRAGLDGIVITEHHHQWTSAELAELVEKSGEFGFLALAAFEYTSSQGDILIYGLDPSQVDAFHPGGPPEEAVAMAIGLGAVCIAAHPTRAGVSFDERIATLPLHGLEVCSVNLKEHEQRLAAGLAKSLKKPMMASSDAHQIQEVGRYATEFDEPIQSMADLQRAVLHGRFRPAGAIPVHP